MEEYIFIAEHSRAKGDRLRRILWLRTELWWVLGSFFYDFFGLFF